MQIPRRNVLQRINQKALPPARGNVVKIFLIPKLFSLMMRRMVPMSNTSYLILVSCPQHVGSFLSALIHVSIPSAILRTESLIGPVINVKIISRKIIVWVLIGLSLMVTVAIWKRYW